jgi:hypothetical protein
MALREHSAIRRSANNRLFTAALRGNADPQSRIYRCGACGEEITFDALAATCRCSEECYAAGAVTAGGDPAVHH